MLNRVLAVLLLCGILACPALAGNGAGISTGFWMSEDVDSTIGATANARWQFGTNLCLEGRLSYFSFGQSFHWGMNVDVIPVETGIIMNAPLGNWLHPYAGLGVGYYLMNGDSKVRTDFKQDMDIKDEFGFYFVAGTEMSVSPRLTVMAEAKYTWLKTSEVHITRVVEPEDAGKPYEEQEGDFDLDVSLNGLSLNIGLLVNF